MANDKKKFCELILKDPLNLMLVSPLYSLDVKKIYGEIIHPKDKKDTENTLNAALAEKILWVQPIRVFASQHPDWLDFEKSAIQLPKIYIPMSNVAGIIERP